MDNLRVQAPGSKYCHFPKRDDYGGTYFSGLLSERLVYKTDRKNPWQWEKIPGHERNEPLDCRNYAMAALKALAPDLDAADRRLQMARGEQTKTVVATVPAVKQKRAQKQNSRASRYYDDW